jgi:hypothetical protein
VLFNEEPRITIVTWQAARAKCMAAWPAALPPPTTTTRWLRVSAASLAPAPLHFPGALEAHLVLEAEPAVGHAIDCEAGESAIRP